jgi:putative phosphoribosyl transferase
LAYPDEAAFGSVFVIKQLHRNFRLLTDFHTRTRGEPDYMQRRHAGGCGMVFRNRVDAGQRLASRLKEFAYRDDTIVLALPRGGVPVGFEVARVLHVPLDILVVRKLGVPGQEELAMGAIGNGGVRILDSEAVRAFHLSPEQVEEVIAREVKELERRERLYRAERETMNVANRTVILVDDGLATGSTMRAAIAVLRQQNVKQIVLAVPVGGASTCKLVGTEADSAVCLFTPKDFYAVGQWYEDFSQTSDEEVRALLTGSEDFLRGHAAG